MNIISRNIKIKWFYPIIILLIILIIALIIWYYFIPDTSQKLNAVISGLITGLFALVLQVWFSWVEIRKIEEFDNLKIIKILSTRDDPEYYRPLISNAKNYLGVFGVTCQRFLDDFANNEKNAPDKNKILLKKLDNGKLKLKILVAGESYLDEENKSKASNIRSRLDWLSKTYPNQFSYAFYDHDPRHSVMIIDNESIVGPIFPGVSSKFSPAIHLKNDSPFVEHYRDYFDAEWAKWYKESQ